MGSRQSPETPCPQLALFSQLGDVLWVGSWSPLWPQMCPVVCPLSVVPQPSPVGSAGNMGGLVWGSCCLLTPCAPCHQWGMEVGVSWTSSGNKVRRYALCHPCTCWRGMKIPGEAAGSSESWGYLLLQRREADRSFIRSKWDSEIFLLENNREGPTLTAWSCGLCTISKMLSYSTWMWVCIPLPKEVIDLRSFHK